MKKIYKELFFIPQDGKIREKVFLVRMILSVAVILCSMAAMSFTAYAYFTHTITATVGVIQAACWDIVVEAPDGVTQAEGYYVIDTTETVETADSIHTTNIPAAEETVFTFKVSKNLQTATATVGYVKVDIKTEDDDFTSTQTFYSQSIGEILKDGEMTTVMEREIKVTVPKNKKVIIQFVGEWGTCAKAPIINDNEGIRLEFADDTEESVEEQETVLQVDEIEQQ